MKLATCLKMAWITGFCVFMCWACDKDETQMPVPEISLNETGVYSIKVGRELKIVPQVLHAEDASFRWMADDGRLLGTDSVFVFSEETPGEYFITLVVTNPGGTTSEELRVDVLELVPPVISFTEPVGGWRVLFGETLELIPEVLNKEDAIYEWKVGKTVVGIDSTFLYTPETPGNYEITFGVATPDGKASETLSIQVVDKVLPTITFERSQQTATQNRLIRLAPLLRDTLSGSYQWTINGEVQQATTPYLDFIPTELKQYTISLQVKALGGEATENIILDIVKPDLYYRVATAGSSAELEEVYEFLAAPGQFVNAGYTATTMEEAAIYAQSTLERGSYVSLGAWGGYIIVGFDHSIDNTVGVYDFEIAGNSFSNSSEPGIVYVMQDENGNGKPDDTWYELKGSAFNEAGTIRDYAVTYYRPKAAGMDVKWTDNQGNSGTVDANSFHQQMYYPLWIEGSSYTLRGTCLKSRTILDGGIWKNQDFEWGYADNYGSDLQQGNNQFNIEHAVDAQGNSVHLDYIDFIKVQTGVQAKGGSIGELSTEVLGFTDLKLKK